jgi:hypothetical protein
VSDNLLRPIVDAEQMYASYTGAAIDAKKYAARMSWQTSISGTKYLVSVLARNGLRQKRSLGVESSETQRIYARYIKDQSEAATRLKNMEQAYEIRVRLNRAHRLGDAPAIVVSVLNEIERANLYKKLIVIGTNALFAYASAARVRPDNVISATQDLDLLWDSRSKIKIASPDPEGLLGLIKRADPSFAKVTSHGYTISNRDGYQIDLIKRNEGFDNLEEPYQPWRNDADFWAVKTKNMDWLLSAPRFSSVVIATNGRMATMNTVDPRAFVLFKYWLSEQKDRDPGKARRDLLQARALEHLIETWLPQLSFQELSAFPRRVRNMVLRNGMS